MEYNKMLEKVFAVGAIPDGYLDNNLTAVRFAFDEKSGATVVVSKCGCFRYQTPPAVDKEEALWLLKNHPASNAVRVSRVS